MWVVSHMGTSQAWGRWVARGWRAAVGRLMKRFHRPTHTHKDQDNEEGPLKVPGAEGSSRLTHNTLYKLGTHSLPFLSFTHTHCWSLSSPSTHLCLLFYTFLFSSLILHSSLTLFQQPPPLFFHSLSLSYAANCCWSAVFLCSQRNVSICSSVNNGVSLLRATKAVRHAMNNTDFSIDSL